MTRLRSGFAMLMLCAFQACANGGIKLRPETIQAFKQQHLAPPADENVRLHGGPDARRADEGV